MKKQAEPGNTDQAMEQRALEENLEDVRHKLVILSA